MFQRTPAVAEGITDHIWSLKELLTFRVPVQFLGTRPDIVFMKYGSIIEDIALICSWISSGCEKEEKL
jgi:hypothetical protein